MSEIQPQNDSTTYQTRIWISGGKTPVITIPKTIKTLLNLNKKDQVKITITKINNEHIDTTNKTEIKPYTPNTRKIININTKE